MTSLDRQTFSSTVSVEVDTESEFKFKFLKRFVISTTTVPVCDSHFIFFLGITPYVYFYFSNTVLFIYSVNTSPQHYPRQRISLSNKTTEVSLLCFHSLEIRNTSSLFKKFFILRHVCRQTVLFVEVWSPLREVE